MTVKFSQAHFITSHLGKDEAPVMKNFYGKPLPEMAIVGRSNVGKSSLINHLLRRHSLAKVSTKPGKTQTLNFFNIDQQLCLVDLPGYGFAKVPGEMKKQWAHSIDNYLKTRQSLQLLIILLDCRRIPSDEDIELILWAKTYQKPFIIILTKFDKLRAKERKPQKEKILQALYESCGKEGFNVLTYSIKNTHMRQVLINKINEFYAPID